MLATNAQLVSNAGYVETYLAFGDASTIPYKVAIPRESNVVSVMTNTSPVNSYASPFVLSDLKSAKYILVAPIVVTLRQTDDEEYIITFPAAEISRAAETPREALAWLRSSIVDLYELYKKREDQLGPLPKRQLRVLEGCLVAKSNTKSRGNPHRQETRSARRSRWAA